ncbi:MAG: hypothetical protein N2115_01875 [bacterium]|nr:hypothetical protein [bacterium]
MLPIIFILALTILAAEVWWFWFIYPNDPYISFPMFLFLEFSVLMCLALAFLSFTGRISERFLFISPLIPPIFYLSIKEIFSLKEQRDDEKKLKQEIAKAMRLSGISDGGKGFEKIGDIYFSRRNYEEALVWFKKAQSINETPEINHKINLVKREILLKQNKIWVCPECSMANPAEKRKCRSCGTSKPSVETLRDELYRNLAEFKKNLVMIIILAVIISLFFWFMCRASFLTSLIFFGLLFLPFAFYMIYRIFSK